MIHRVLFAPVIGVRQRTATDRGAKQVGSVGLGLGAAGLAAQICYPLVDGSLRERVTVAVVLLLAGACVAHAAATRGTRWATGLVVVTMGGGLLAEFVGTATGVPFGGYVYTTDGALGPELGSVPLLIGLAWTVGAYPAWCAAQAIVGPGRGPVTVLVAAWGLASWDLYLDPQMVADGRWVWTDAGQGLPGVSEVPLSNYAGWLLVALVLGAALHRVDRALGTPQPGPDGLPLALFCWTWLGSALAHAAFLDLPASAGYGLVGMGLVGVPLLGTLLLACRPNRRARPAGAGLPAACRCHPRLPWTRQSARPGRLCRGSGAPDRHRRATGGRVTTRW